MKRNKGFTLIELIAVIVVLAIIALIAVPKVTQIIEDSEKKTIKNSASNLIRTVDMYLVQTNKKYGVVDILDENLNYSGEKLEYGKIEINKKGNSRMYAYKDGYCITKTYSGEIEIEESTKEDCSGFVDIELLCTPVTELSTQKYYNGNITTYEEEKVGLLASEAGQYAYGVEYTCELGDNDSKTFYVLENNDDTVSLIMNMNIDSNGLGTTSGSGSAWCDDESLCKVNGEWNNSSGPVTALEYLKNSTTSWTKLKENQISMPTYDQIYKAAGNKGSNLPTWLYINLNAGQSYWTLTAPDSPEMTAWYLNVDFATLDYTGINGNKGIRPVITISKSQLG